MEYVFGILFGIWLGTSIAIIELDVIKPILERGENDYI